MHVHVDPLGGLAGDMFLAAAIDADLVQPESVEQVLEKLGLGTPQVVVEQARRKGLTGTHVRFVLPETEEPASHRHLSAILDLLNESRLSPAVCRRAQSMFHALGTVEAQIHGIPVEEVHFHEVGALDSIFDLVTAAWLIETTDATWSVAPLSVGSGTTDIAHGTVPLPVPATSALLQGFEVVSRSVEAELVTPTGATILSTLRDEDCLIPRPDGKLQAVGYGAGTRQLDELANIVRFTCIELATDGRTETVDEVCRLSCDIDDMTPEGLAHVETRLFAEGALDVVREAVLMKKGRQGSRLSVLCRPEDRERIVELILRETSTFGVRDETVRRVKLARSTEPVETRFGAVSVKIGFYEGTPVKASPEYSDCAARAAEHDVPFREVYQAAQDAGRELLASDAVAPPAP